MAKPKRQAMPRVAAFIDALREAFGASQIDRSIRAGIDGQPTFLAAEAGQEIGHFYKAGARTSAASAYPGTDHVTPIRS